MSLVILLYDGTEMFSPGKFVIYDSVLILYCMYSVHNLVIRNFRREAAETIMVRARG